MKFYITTPIYYINDKPHIGHAYATIVADVFTRYHRLIGDEVFFLTGTDENSLKNVEAATKTGMSDQIQEYLDKQSAVWQQTWDSLGITHSDFIRTTESRHKKGVEKFFKTVYDKGDIYKGTYQGFYCKGCEAFVRETDLIDGLCPFHKTSPDRIEEENYFFRASQYREQLLKHIEANPDFIQPESRRNEIINYIRDHFEDVSISRQNISIGIPLPIDPSHVVYVWFDALINYLTGIGFGWNEELFKKFWPADVHIVGKDIIKFHCALWPAMLMSAGLPLPKKVFAHGFFTINGQRIGKSLGNAIDPTELGSKYGLDSLRYFLLREIPFGGDGDFSFERVEQRYNADLAKGLGNFTSRVLTLAEKLPSEMISTISKENLEEETIKNVVEHTWKSWHEGFEKYEIDQSLDAVWALITEGDRCVDRTKPWALIKEDEKSAALVLSTLLELLRHLSILIYPFLPATSEKIWTQLCLDHEIHTSQFAKMREWRAVEIEKVKKGDSLFPVILERSSE